MFQYMALTTAGELCAGNMDAGSASDVINRLQAQGYLPISARVAADQSRPKLRDLRVLRRRGDTTHDVSIVTRELAALLRAGLPLDRALSLVISLAAKTTVKEAFHRILARVRDGSSFAQAAAEQKQLFPQSCIGLFLAGEASGALQNALENVSHYLERARELKEAVRSALTYPILLLVMSALSLVLIVTLVLPEFEPLFAEADVALPISTQITMGAGHFIREQGWLVAVLIVLTFVGFHQALERPSVAVKWHSLKLRAALLGPLILKAETSRLARVLAVLLQQGLPAPHALRIAADAVSNIAISEGLRTAARQTKEGDGIALPLERTNLFPGLLVQLVRVGEQTGNLPEMLLHVAELLEREVRREIDRLLTLLVPVVTVTMGLLIGGIIASILLAILTLNDLAV